MDGRMNTLDTSVGEVREVAKVARERADTGAIAPRLPSWGWLKS